MAECEVCGKETGRRWLIKIGNSKLSACENCKSHGKVIKKEKQVRKKKKTKKSKKKPKNKKSSKQPEKMLLDSDYSEKIKNKREEKGFTQEELANQINEKESIIRKIEAGKIDPTEKIAKELEHKLKIDLFTEPANVGKFKKRKKKKKKTTIGDVIKLKGEK